MTYTILWPVAWSVALLAEGVDRNTIAKALDGAKTVALLAEGVDRNLQGRPGHPAPIHVALLAEGVDRNRTRPHSTNLPTMSPSSRRAWIEMASMLRAAVTRSVALLAEGVDRNANTTRGRPQTFVALLAEGVDRNPAYLNHPGALLGRPPRGGRG